MRDAEASLRTLDAYVGVLQGRLTLARISGVRNEFEPVTDGDLALLALQCERTTAAVDAILYRIAPELASTAAAIADVEYQRTFTEPRPPAAARLRLIKSDRGA